MLRILFSRLGQPHIGSAQAFSFNVASISGAGAVAFERGGKTVKERRSFSITGGMCPRCEGLGTVSDIDLAQLFDDSKSLNEGAITVPGYTGGGWNSRLYSASGFFDPDKPIRKFTKQEMHDFLHHEPVRMKIAGINMTYEGLIPRIQKSMLAKDKEAMQQHVRAFADRAVTFTACPECGGTRLSEAARSSRIKGVNIAEACAMQTSDLAEWVDGLDEPSVAPLLAALGQTLDSFVEIGLGYLSLDRPSATLSGGEAQRTKMIRQLGSSLTDVTYVFDEPTIGMHPHDIQRMNGLLLRLRDKGNTVLVVEHKPEAIAIADHVVDLGPRAGTEPAAPSPAAISTTGPPSRRRSGPPPARWRSAVRQSTTCATSTSTSRSACSPSSPASPAPARAPSCRAQSPAARAWCPSVRARSAARVAATRRRTPDCSTRSATRSLRPTA
jgi:ABC-type dipeptide/oligopeptide/nickel transport system ATPase subunit